MNILRNDKTLLQNCRVNEEMMESLFGYTTAEKTKSERRKDSSLESPHYIQIIDAKKSQNLAILLKALNVTTEEVCDALKEGLSLSLSQNLCDDVLRNYRACSFSVLR